MPDHTRFTQELKVMIAQTRELVQRSALMLDEPVPSTFLGRPTFTAFPAANDNMGNSGVGESGDNSRHD